MNALPLRPRPPREIIDAAIAAHGPARVLFAAVAALLRPRARPPDARPRGAVAVPDRLRRDVGLPERPPEPPGARPDPLAAMLRGGFGPRL